MGQHEMVRFSATGASVSGALAGAAIAIGVPWVLLTHGQALGSSTQTLLVWVAVVMGGVTTMMSAFFGLVMPSQVGGAAEHGNPWGGNPFEAKDTSAR